MGGVRASVAFFRSSSFRRLSSMRDEKAVGFGDGGAGGGPVPVMGRVVAACDGVVERRRT